MAQFGENGGDVVQLVSKEIYLVTSHVMIKLYAGIVDL